MWEFYHLEKKIGFPDLVTHTFNLTLKRQKQASLVYKVNFRTATATQRNLVWGEKMKEGREGLKRYPSQ